MKPQFSVDPRSAGYSLIELMLVLALLAACVGAGATWWCRGLVRGEARGCAQSWQAAAALGQVEVLWQGGRSEVSASAGGVGLTHDPGSSGLALEGWAPICAIDTNIARWRIVDGARVAFGGHIASPDSGGSVYFGAAAGCYRVIVRPESGLTIRGWVDR
jgi:prepilin-type N-terminal cleavage/methylation domain-containing protein